MAKHKGHVTLPIESPFTEEMKNILLRWGVDAVRIRDGGKFPGNLEKSKMKTYATYSPTIQDQDWINEHPDQLQQIYLITPHETAIKKPFQIELMREYFQEQIKIDEHHDPKVWWEVVDRTMGKTLSSSDWSYDSSSQSVIIHTPMLFHSYTITFLAWQIWDPTQMYNHFTYNWDDRSHEMPYDVRHSEAKQHMLQTFRNWIRENDQVDVIKFTTFFYHFTLLFNQHAKEKFVDWFGYATTVSPRALENFEKEYGYRIRPEDIVDQGYYNTVFRNPSKKYLDWMEFQQKFVCKLIKEIVEIVHQEGREAMMFLGNSWIGTEPYGLYFKNTKLDAIMGSVGNGTTLRMLSEISGIKYTEGRFLPFFFQDVLVENENLAEETLQSWIQIRRAILRKPIDRIGYDGDLNAVLKCPDFVEVIEKVCHEFRDIKDHLQCMKPYVPPFKVGILNAWGKIRSWQSNMAMHALWHKKIYTYMGVLESLSGMALEIEFLSFDEIKKQGIPRDIKVIINAGEAPSAWSGHDHWKDEKLVSLIRAFVYQGGGFIGIGEPSAYLYHGKFFQLSDVLGVDKEIGYTIGYTNYDQEILEASDHFILRDQKEQINCGEKVKSIRATSVNTQILQMQRGDIILAAHEFGKGRGVYIAGLPYSVDNARLLLRAIYWAARQEEEFQIWHSENIYTECSYYPESKLLAVINNSMFPQNTIVYGNHNMIKKFSLAPYEIVWAKM